MDEELQFDPVVRIEHFLDVVFDRLAAAEAPVWEGQNEMARTLITLSSGALVLTVSLVQFLAGQLPNPSWIPLLITSWIAFGISVVAGVVRHGWASKARSYRLRFEASRGTLRQAIRNLTDSDNWSDEVNRLIEESFKEATRDSEKAEKVHDGLIITSGWSFIVGLVLLLAFTIRNLPF